MRWLPRASVRRSVATIHFSGIHVATFHQHHSDPYPPMMDSPQMKCLAPSIRPISADVVPFQHHPRDSLMSTGGGPQERCLTPPIDFFGFDVIVSQENSHHPLMPIFSS